MVSGIVTQSGGHIVVNSETNEGAEFRLHFPKDKEPTARFVKESEPGEKSGTILLVDDEPSLRSLLSRKLVAGGFHVLEASSGEEALAAIRNADGAVNLLVSDAVMPGDLLLKVRELLGDAGEP